MHTINFTFAEKSSNKIRFQSSQNEGINVQQELMDRFSPDELPEMEGKYAVFFPAGCRGDKENDIRLPARDITDPGRLSLH